MTTPVPIEIDSDINREVLTLLDGTSCHSDIIIPLQKYLKSYEDVQSYCPDGKNFSYICWHVNRVIFAYAKGMEKVTVRLTQVGELGTSKLDPADGFQECHSWYSVPYNASELEALVKSAYESAKSL